jgi:hypothetical protein
MVWGIMKMNNFYFFTIELPKPFPLYPPENPNPYGDYEDDIDE